MEGKGAVERKDWRRGQSRSNVGRELAAGWFILALWSVLTAPLAYKLWTDDQIRSSPWAWFMGLFVVVGLLMAVSTTRRTLAWLRFGRLTLDLDPSPGSLGGHVGGSLKVGLRAPDPDAFRVTLSCVHSVVRGRGKNRSRSERVVWSQEQAPALERASRGVRIGFTFAVPDHLPATQPHSNDYHYWAVRIVGRVPGLDLDQSFQVPVEATPEPLLARAPALETGSVAAPDPWAESPVSVREEGRETVMWFPAFRTPAMGFGLTVTGLVFTGFPATMLVSVARELMGSGAFGVGMLVMASPVLLIFSVVGLALVMLGVYELLNALTVRLTAETLTTRRRMLVFGITRSARVAEVERVELKITGQTGSGAAARVAYTLTAHLAGGGRIVLGDGIRGPALAGAVAETVTRVTGLEVVHVERRRKRHRKGSKKSWQERRKQDGARDLQADRAGGTGAPPDERTEPATAGALEA